ncbi:phage terminase small subunit [Chitinimonas koreensis]|uniref:phage terminase small subunit n=1 Tax=Chitinimonas koreensis TaxID=356302 RepID=UPI000491693C|nr:phage terminase small subunit [Chitinimonas koreensis]
MISPARAHAMRAAAAAQQAAPADTARADATAYELMLAKLHADKRRLKAIESQAAKIECKRKLLPDYVHWIDGALRGTGAQDDVLMTVLVWRIDAGDWRGALDIAAYALKHGLLLPDQYQRNLPCLIAEEIADNALKFESVPRDVLIETDQMLAGHDMPDQVRAKLAKAIGYALVKEAGDGTAGTSLFLKQQAVQALERAKRLHDKVGVTKDLERLGRELKNSAPPAPPAGTG